jgi:hypothetical protein
MSECLLWFHLKRAEEGIRFILELGIYKHEVEITESWRTNESYQRRITTPAPHVETRRWFLLLVHSETNTLGTISQDVSRPASQPRGAGKHRFQDGSPPIPPCGNEMGRDQDLRRRAFGVHLERQRRCRPKTAGSSEASATVRRKLSRQAGRQCEKECLASLGCLFRGEV